jgi:hypothetical protein
LVILLALSLCGTAFAAPVSERIYSEPPAQPSAPIAERTYSAPTRQLAPIAERTYSDAPAAQSAASVQPGSSHALAAPVAPAASSSNGLSALAIVLISVGGALALLAVAYTATRIVHHGHPAS